MVVVGLIAPAAIIFFVCLIFVPGPTADPSTPKSLIWRRKFWEWNSKLLRPDYFPLCHFSAYSLVFYIRLILILIYLAQPGGWASRSASQLPSCLLKA